MRGQLYGIPEETIQWMAQENPEETLRHAPLTKYPWPACSICRKDDLSDHYGGERSRRERTGKKEQRTGLSMILTSASLCVASRRGMIRDEFFSDI